MKRFDPKEHIGILIKFINGKIINKINNSSTIGFNNAELIKLIKTFRNLI